MSMRMPWDNFYTMDRQYVAFDVGGVLEYVQNGVNGILVPEYDNDGFIDAIDKLSAD